MAVLTSKAPVAVMLDVIHAILDADAKHGELTKEPVRACAILIRECGEAMNEALLLTAPVKDAKSDDRNIRFALYNELAQVAATAVKIMQQLVDEGVMVVKQA